MTNSLTDLEMIKGTRRVCKKLTPLVPNSPHLEPFFIFDAAFSEKSQEHRADVPELHGEASDCTPRRYNVTQTL